MDQFLSNMSAKQAQEWVLFSKIEPQFEDKIMIQIAQIASTFANAYMKRKDGKNWNPHDFIPTFDKSEENEKKVDPNLSKKLLGLKESKDKKKTDKRFDKKDMVKGTDGRYYKYALEEFVKDKVKKIPKRLRKVRKK